MRSLKFALVSGSYLRVRATADCLDVFMKDSVGDGWNGAEYTIVSVNNEVVATGTFFNGPAQKDEVCLDTGCYALSVSAGSNPEDISWSLAANSGTLLNGSAPFGPWRFELSEQGDLMAGCKICSCESCVHIEIESGAGYELVSSNNSLISSGLIGASMTDTICANGDECYTFEVTGTGNWSIGSNNFAGSAPFGPKHLTVTNKGLVSHGCSTSATCSSCNSTCVQVQITSATVEGGGVSYELLEVGKDESLATRTLLRGEFEISTAVCVDLPGGCHNFEVYGAGNWSIGNLSGEAPYGPLYVTIEEDGTVVESCDKEYIGVCERSSCEAGCDVDYIKLGIQCSDLAYPEKTSGCVCIGALDCQSCHSDSNFRLLTEDESERRFVHHERTTVLDDDASVQYIVGIEIISVAMVVQQGLSLHVEGDDDHAAAWLDGAGTTQLFVVESDARLSVASLTLQNGYSDEAGGGGCILMGSGAELRLEDVVLKDCIAISGGAVAVYSRSVVVATNIKVYRARAMSGSGGGFFLIHGSRISIFNSIFDECLAVVYGGSLYMGKEGTANLINVTIRDSSASQWGGGIYGDEASIIKVSDSRIEDCSAEFGGGIFGFTGSNVSIDSTDVVNCQASLSGGGVYGHIASVIEVTASRIENCSCELSAGGGLFGDAESRISITNTDVVNCQASRSGGGVYGHIASVIEVTASRIEECSAENGGGLFGTTGSRIYISNTDTLSCQASQHGGGIFAPDNSLTKVIDSRIEDCSAEFGGGIFGFTGSNVSIDSTDVVNCQASLSGGGVYGHIASVIEVTASRIENCSCGLSAGGGGGGGLFGYNESRISINDTDVVNCQASLGGGGVNGYENSRIRILDSRIKDCSANSGGGVAGFFGSLISIGNTKIVNCRASQFHGGGVFGASDMEVMDSRVEGCSAGSNGGGLYGFIGSRISIGNTVIENCEASQQGGGIYAFEESFMQVADSRIESCSAGSFGGGLYSATKSRISIDDTDIVNCSADEIGGGIYGYTMSVIEVTNSRIRDCFSASLGGGVFAYIESRVSLHDTEVVNCNTSRFGGCVYGSATTLVEIIDSRIEACSAENGGGLYGYVSSRIYMKNTDMVNCQASKRGGGIFGDTASVIEVLDSRITKCAAMYDGGAVFLSTRAQGIFYTSQLARNSAINGGAIFASDADTISIGAGVAIESNKAEGNGGSIYAISRDTNDNYILISSSNCTWVILEHDFESNAAASLSAYSILYSQSQRNTNDARGRSTLNDVQPGRKVKYTYCLAPGEYTLYCHDVKSTGWETGTATLELLNMPTTDEAINKTFTCKVSSGNHVDAHSFVIPASSNRESSAPLFRGNEASVGGSIFAESIDVFIADAIFMDNSAKAASADEGGGAINANAYSIVDATRSMFSNNCAKAAIGGAIHTGFGGRVQIQNCITIGNTAQSGGFLSLMQTNNVLITSTAIIDGTALGGNGGGLYSRAQRGDFSVVSTTFRNNTATDSDSAGGAICLQDGYINLEGAIFEENIVHDGLGGGGMALFNSNTAFIKGDSCIFIEIQIDLRTTNEVCAVFDRGSTCDSFINLCSELEASNNIDRVCAGCACAKERGVNVDGTQFGAKVTIETATGYAAALHSTSFCLKSNETYQIYAFDDLGRGLDGGSWSVVVLDSELPLDVAGFTDIFTTSDGTTHYLGASFDGDTSAEITFSVAAKDPEVSMFRKNQAKGGGGGALYIDQGVGSSDALPSGLVENVLFEENSAAYGPVIASPPRVLQPKSSKRVSIPSGGIVDPDNTIIVELRDQYDQITAISSQKYVASMDVPEAISSAGTSSIFEDGSAVFSDLLITKTPGTNVTAIITTNVASLEPEESSLIDIINLLKCVSGEEQTKTQCIACPESEYSFYPEEPCHKCPDRGTCRGRNSIIPDSGFWKSAFDSTNIRRCPSRQACNSVNETDLIANTLGTHLHPNAQCASHHRGPLCATCEHKYFLTSGECRDCRPSHRRDAIIALIILAIAVLIIGAFMELSGCKKGCYAAISLVIPYLSDIQSVVKQVIVFYDVTSKLSQSFPSVRVPPIFADFQIICAVFGLDIALYLRQACIYSFDHIDLLYGVTLIPLALIGMGSLLYLAMRQRWTMERRIKVFSTVSFALLAFIYLILTTTSSIIIRTLQCDDDFDDASEEAHSPYYQDSYLYADYNVNCRTRRWRVAQVYAIFMLFVYPIGIPFFYLVCLLSIKSLIAPSDARKVADATIEKDCPPIASGESIEECRPYDRRDERHSKVSLKIRVLAAVSYLHKKRNDRRAEQWKDARQLAVAYVDEDNAIKKILSDNTATSNFQRVANDRESIRKARLLTLHKHLVKETRVLEKACWPYKFLFDGYGITSWFWEVFECFRRIVLTCLLPFPGSDTDSFSQYILGAVFALSFGFAYACFRPFDSSEINSLAIFVQLLIILNYMAMMLLYVDQNLSDEDDTTGLKSKHVGWFLITTNAILLPICSIIVCIIECKKHAAFVFHQQSGRLPIELTALSSNQYTIEDEKDECEDPGFLRLISERSDDEATGISEVDHPDVQHDSNVDVLLKNDHTLNQDFDEDTSA